MSFWSVLKKQTLTFDAELQIFFKRELRNDL